MAKTETEQLNRRVDGLTPVLLTELEKHYDAVFGAVGNNFALMAAVRDHHRRVMPDMWEGEYHKKYHKSMLRKSA